MRGFQLDENFNSKSLRSRCNSGGHCHVHRFPPNLSGTKDPELLPIMLARESPLVTLDRRMIENHLQFIPEPNSGIIVVKTINTKQTITNSIASTIVDKFKTLYPDWHSTDWSGKCLELDLVCSTVSVLRPSNIIPVGVVQVSQTDFSARLYENIRKADELIFRSKATPAIER